MHAEATSQSQLMLAVEAGEGAVDRLAAVLGVVPVASVVISSATAATLTADDALPLIKASQAAGAAALITSDARLARTLKADGTHLPFSETLRDQYETARAILGGGAIIGADVGRSRHDAMTLGELGADYVAFGIPSFVKDRVTAFERQLALVAWWAEIFEMPCVAMDVPGSTEARALAEAGADFVCLGLGGGIPVGGTAALAQEWSEAMDRRRTG